MRLILHYMLHNNYRSQYMIITQGNLHTCTLYLGTNKRWNLHQVHAFRVLSPHVQMVATRAHKYVHRNCLSAQIWHMDKCQLREARHASTWRFSAALACMFLLRKYMFISHALFHSF
jgi:hypothetical protein